jgi:hypothetical protein
MKSAPESASLLGRTIRWTCTDGPVAGQIRAYQKDEMH